MKIHLHPEVRSGLGEDTFWLWAKREFPNSVWFGEAPQEKGDVILQYSTLGKAPEGPATSIALCWELYPEMVRQMGPNPVWVDKVARTKACAEACDRRVASSHLVVKDYEMHGDIDILPIGVNGDVFKPMNNKEELRKKHNIPLDRQVAIWCGTKHPMKGFDTITTYAHQNPDIFWIIIWKSRRESTNCTFEGQAHIHVTQDKYAELMNCSDYYAMSGLLEPYYMCEWEAMACDLPFLNLRPHKVKDFVPSESPRNDLAKMGWLRKHTKKLWLDYIARVAEA